MGSVITLNSVMKGLTPDAYAPDEYMLNQYCNIM